MRILGVLPHGQRQYNSVDCDNSLHDIYLSVVGLPIQESEQSHWSSCHTASARMDETIEMIRAITFTFSSYCWAAFCST